MQISDSSSRCSARNATVASLVGNSTGRAPHLRAMSRSLSSHKSGASVGSCDNLMHRVWRVKQADTSGLDPSDMTSMSCFLRLRITERLFALISNTTAGGAVVLIRPTPLLFRLNLGLAGVLDHSRYARATFGRQISLLLRKPRSNCNKITGWRGRRVDGFDVRISAPGATGRFAARTAKFGNRVHHARLSQGGPRVCRSRLLLQRRGAGLPRQLPRIWHV